MARFCPKCGELYPADFERCSVDGARLAIELEDELLGKQLASYEIREKIGGGGIGDVYRAYDHQRRTDVALKILKMQAATNRTALQRFEREAQVVQKLQHPNLVSILDFGYVSGLHYIALELIQGKTLHRVLSEGGPMDPARVTKIGVQVARGLSMAHERGLVHRDLKPGNIMLTPQGPDELVRVLDFSIVGFQEGHEEGPRLTKHGTTVGTPAYMAPEQMQQQRIDGRADIYALGIVLFEMLVGVPPFMGPYMVILKKKLTEPPPGLPAYDGLGGLVLSMLSISPDRRPQSAGEVAARLEQTLRVIEPQTQELAVPSSDFVAVPRGPMMITDSFEDSGSGSFTEMTEATQLVGPPMNVSSSVSTSSSVSFSDEAVAQEPTSWVAWMVLGIMIALVIGIGAGLVVSLSS